MTQEVEFNDTRFNPDETPLHEHAKKLAKAFGHGAGLHVDPEIAQLLRLHVAQVNVLTAVSCTPVKRKKLG